MTEIFYVECPGCAESKGPITTHAGTLGIHCSCGVSARVDIEAQEISDWWER
ncbi:hypothetical protein [Halorubrum ezzemoulense]|uniref:hypothetical protein n=1 Tax=Halorubrum ezzemoulense TaxID=337243 RepID=UPI0015C659D7|nr:hypothetical protein [Halorubrum ezzemoulense]